MRIKRVSSWVVVQVSDRDIGALRCCFPLHRLETLGRLSVWFEPCGDLVDLETWDRGGRRRDSIRFEGAALLALVVDARAFAVRRGVLSE